MPMEEALTARLVGVAGSATVDWFERPRGVWEAVVLTKVSPGQEWTMSGPDGLYEPRVQIDCWSLSKAAAMTRARTVLAEMTVARTVAGATFHPASLELERFDVEQVAGVGTVFLVSQDFMFNFEEA